MKSICNITQGEKKPLKIIISCNWFIIFTMLKRPLPSNCLIGYKWVHCCHLIGLKWSLIRALCVCVDHYVKSCTDEVNWPRHSAALPWSCRVHTSSSFFIPTPLLICCKTKATCKHSHTQTQGHSREEREERGERGDTKLSTSSISYLLTAKDKSVSSPGFSFIVTGLKMVGCREKQRNELAHIWIITNNVVRVANAYFS